MTKEISPFVFFLENEEEGLNIEANALINGSPFIPLILHDLLLHNRGTAYFSRSKTIAYPTALSPPLTTTDTHYINRSNPLPSSANLPIPRFPLTTSHICVFLDHILYLSPDSLSFPNAMFVSQDIISKLANADPWFVVSFWVLQVECCLSGETIKSDRDEVWDKGSCSTTRGD
jgi:hypothetical protein